MTEDATLSPGASETGAMDPKPDKPALAYTGPGGNLDLDNVFTYHPPVGDQIERYQRLRTAGREMAVLIEALCPSSPERSTALAKCREAVMWANAAIACHEKPTPEPEQADPTTDWTNGPHSRACGIANHPHGTACHVNCPTCHGRKEA